MFIYIKVVLMLLNFFTRDKFMKDLCKIGNDLWQKSSFERYNTLSYKKYIEHIKMCSVCQEGLDLKVKDIEILEEFFINKRG